MTTQTTNPTISWGTVMFLWSVIALAATGIAIHSIVITDDVVIADVIKDEVMPTVFQTTFTPRDRSPDITGSIDRQAGSNPNAPEISRLSQQIAVLTSTVEALERENARLRDDRTATTERLARIEAAFASITGSLQQSPIESEPVPGSGLSVEFSDLEELGEPRSESELEPGTVNRTEFGISLFRGNDITAMSRTWSRMLQDFPDIVSDLEPRISLETSVDGPGLMLLAGPVKNAETAARLCARLSLSSERCQPVPFQGDPLHGQTAVAHPE